MKKKIRMAAIALTLVVLGITACSSPKTGETSTADNSAGVPAAEDTGKETDSSDVKTAEAQEPFKVTFVLKSLGSNYWVQLKAGAVDKAGELGVDLEVLAPSSDNATEDQIRMLEDQVVSGADLVLVAPSNSGAQMATFDKVVDAGIPLVCVDTNAKEYDKKTAFIGSSNEEVGRQAGEYLAEKVMEKEGAIIILRGQLGDETADTRSKGCIEALTKAGFTNIIEQPANNDRNTAMSVMENMLQSNDNITAVYGTNDEMALGAARALQAAQDTKVVVVGTNADVDALVSIVENTGVTASIRQDPYTMGATAVETAVACLKGETVEPVINIPVRVIDIEEAQTTLDSVNAVLNAAK